MKRNKLKYCLIIAAFCITSCCYAQGNSGGSNGNGPPFPCPPNNPVCGGQPGLPIDGGLLILLFSGISFGIYAIKKSKTP